MRMKVAAIFAFMLNTVLFATYYSVSKEALQRIDPIIFSYFEMMSLVPAALCILILSRRQITRAVVRRGVVLGSSLCLALFTIGIALKYTSATSTAFFPSLNGFLAAFIAWIFLRQPIAKATWFAGLLSIAGAALLILNAEMGGIRGSLIAFLGGLFFTFYVFLSDQEQKEKMPPWPLFGIELLTMALWANLVVLLFGDWQAVHPALPKDIWVVLYVAGACTFLPTLIAAVMQKYLSAVTVSFIYILEPVLGAVMASFYLREQLALPAYLGGGLVVVGAIIHTWGARPTSEQRPEQRLLQEGRRFNGSLLAALLYPVLLLSAGVFILCGLGGFPPAVWGTVYRLLPKLLTLVQQGQATYVSLLLAQALGWLLAWTALIIMSLAAVRRARRKIRDVSKMDTRPVPYAIRQPGTDIANGFSYLQQAQVTSRVGQNEFSPYEIQLAGSFGEVNTDGWEMRSLRQMGIATHPTSAKRRDKPLVERRRRERRARLAANEGADMGTAFLVQDLEESALSWSASVTGTTRPRWATPEVIEVWQEG